MNQLEASAGAAAGAFVSLAGLLEAYFGSLPPNVGNPCASGYCAPMPPVDNTLPLARGGAIFLGGLLMVLSGFRHVHHADWGSRSAP